MISGKTRIRDVGGGLQLRGDDRNMNQGEGRGQQCLETSEEEDEPFREIRKKTGSVVNTTLGLNKKGGWDQRYRHGVLSRNERGHKTNATSRFKSQPNFSPKEWRPTERETFITKGAEERWPPEDGDQCPFK